MYHIQLSLNFCYIVKCQNCTYGYNIAPKQRYEAGHEGNVFHRDVWNLIEIPMSVGDAWHTSSHAIVVLIIYYIFLLLLL